MVLLRGLPRRVGVGPGAVTGGSGGFLSPAQLLRQLAVPRHLGGLAVWSSARALDPAWWPEEYARRRAAYAARDG